MSLLKGLEVCYCLWGCHPDPRLGPVLGPSRSHPGSEGVPSRFAMCFVFQHFGPIQVPRWGPSRPVLVPSCSRAFLPGSGLDGPKQTSRPLPTTEKGKREHHNWELRMREGGGFRGFSAISLNCLSCRIPYPSFTECLALIQWKGAFLHQTTKFDTFFRNVVI